MMRLRVYQTTDNPRKDVSCIQDLCPWVLHFHVLTLTRLGTRRGQEARAAVVVESLCLLVWRRCNRLCPNKSAGPLRLFTGRNRVGFWRRSCASSEIWI